MLGHRLDQGIGVADRSDQPNILTLAEQAETATRTR
jgi:hypothetical protein